MFRRTQLTKCTELLYVHAEMQQLGTTILYVCLYAIMQVNVYACLSIHNINNIQQAL